MSNDFSPLDNILSSSEQSTQIADCRTDVVSVGPNLLLSLVNSTATQLSKLDVVADRLINHFLDPKTIKGYTDKEKEKLLMNIAELQRDKRDALTRYAELANKNDIFNKLMKEINSPTETVIDQTGVPIQTKDLSLKKAALKNLIVEILNERYHQ
jgi:hypothetical protein